MRPLALLSSLLTVVGLVSAQYFSAGWNPGQPVPTLAAEQPLKPVQPTGTGAAEKHGYTPHKPSFLDNLVTSGPVSAIASLVGFDFTGSSSVLWDERIPLITDSNYEDLIVNEKLSPEEEEARVWFIVITVTAGQPESVSKFVDGVFDATYNYTLEHGGLEHVRFGRIDYLDVTAITTKWAVWSAPMLVVLKDRGKTLRFYKAGQVRLTDELLYQFLNEEAWRNKEPWSTVWSPGGEREWILDYYALVLSMVYRQVVRVPKWLMYMISGGLATFIINLLHRPKAAETQPKAVPKPVAPTVTTQKEETQATPTRSQKTPNKRKGKK